MSYREIDYIVTDVHTGKRLDVFLAEVEDLTRSQIQLSVRENLIKINSKIIKKTGYLLKINDKITGNIRLVSDMTVSPEDIPLDILYEDDHMLVINKSAGMTVHPTSHLKEGTLVNALLHKYQLSDLDEARPGIVHRLDRDTSGLILVAKNNKAHMLLAEQFAQRRVEKIYQTIVYGHPKESSGTIATFLGRHPKDRKKMAVLPDNTINAKIAITHWEAIEYYSRGERTSLLQIKIETGRTHQIRVHMAYLGHPIVGDATYCSRSSKYIKRQCLHAKSIRFEHPISGEEMFFGTELPADIERVRGLLSDGEALPYNLTKIKTVSQ